MFNLLRSLPAPRFGMGLLMALVALLFVAGTALAFNYSGTARLFGIYRNSSSSSIGSGTALGIFNLRSTTQPSLLPGDYAGMFRGSVDGTTVNFYCIQLHQPISFPQNNYGLNGVVNERTGYIVTNFYPNGPIATANSREEAAAVQLAIWSQTNGLDTTKVYVTSSGFNSAESVRIRNRATAIRNAAVANGDANQHIANSLAFATTGGAAGSSNELGQPIQFRVQARDQSGTPMAGVPITVSTDSGTLSPGSSTTGADGYTTTFTLTGNTVGNPVVTAVGARTNKTIGARYFRVNSPSTIQAVVLASRNSDTIRASNTYTFTPATPAVTTNASNDTVVGTPINDVATLSGGYAPTGTITFRLYGPNSSTCAGAALLFTDSKTVSGNGNYASASYTPTAPGTYRWIANYGGDAKNIAVTNPCNAANENVVIAKRSPTLTTNASPDTTLGNSVFDTATLAGGHNPTGIITFNLYGPDDATCTTAPIFTDTATVSGNGIYTSDSYTPLALGTYRWIANYGGDANNNATANACNAANEDVVVDLTNPALTTQASSSVAVGSPIYDTASLSGGLLPTGTITFDLYGPDDATCETSIFTDVVNVGISLENPTGNGDYISAEFTPAVAGEYRWIAAYSGDIANQPETGDCGEATENVIVTQFVPTLTTNASDDIIVGFPISDTATLSGGTAPTGTISFELYGPDNANCEGTPIFTDEVVVDDNGEYTSAEFTTIEPGEYRWIADYSGDVNNAAVNNECNGLNENVITRLPFPGEGLTLTTNAADDIIIGGSIFDTATLGGEPILPPVGTITFSLYGPNDEICETAIFTDEVMTTSTGDYDSAPFVPTELGTYYWIATYTELGATEPTLVGTCGEPGETETVRPIPPTLMTNSTYPSDDVLLGNPVHDVAFLEPAEGEGPVPAEGTIGFDLYGPNDEACETSIFHSDVDVVETGMYASAEFTPTEPGIYYWIEAFTPTDVDAETLVGECGAPNESVTVNELNLTTNASDDVVLGGSVHDTASLFVEGVEEPIEVFGTIGFDLYGPNDVECATSIFHDDVEVTQTGEYDSESFTPTAIGTYYWIETFTPEGEEEPTMIGECGAPEETVTVTEVAPSPTPVPLTPVAPTSTPPTSLSDTATGSDGTGRVDVTLLLALLALSAAAYGSAAFVRAHRPN